MRARPKLRRWVLLGLTAVTLGPAGCGSGDDPPPPRQALAWDVPVAEVVEAMGEQGLACTDLRLATLPPRNTRHAGICRLRGEWVEVVTFGDSQERFAFLSSRRREEDTMVAGPKWAVGLERRVLAERVQGALGGELVPGTIAVRADR